MYGGGYNPTNSEFTNNPFINDIDSAGAQNRYPDISSPDPSAVQYTSWMQPGSSQPGLQSAPLLVQPTGLPFQQQGQYSSPTVSLGSGFQPSSMFGQQMTAMSSPVNGSSYSYIQGNVAPQEQNYLPARQQLQNNPGYIAQFDPYSSISQGWGDSSNGKQQQQSLAPAETPLSPGATGTWSTEKFNGNLHPREYIRTHKSEIDSWDSYAWKQLVGSFDALKDAWGARKTEIERKARELLAQMQYSAGGYYPGQLQQEAARLQGLAKEAESHHDSIAASSFQIYEVFETYRQSGDPASKRRVREASNAALQGLPDWPGPLI